MNSQNEVGQVTQLQGKMPDAIHALFADIAKIRNTILVNAPACLPQLAPVLIDAEDQVRSLWKS